MTKDHIKCIERILADWSKGDLEELVKEGRTLKHRLPRNGSARANTNLAHSFTKLIFMGKCKAALVLISNMEKGGILNLNDPADCDNPTPPTIREVLISKHPQFSLPIPTASFMSHRTHTQTYLNPLIPG